MNPESLPNNQFGELRLRPPGGNLLPGGFWRRLVAVLIDGFVLGIAQIPIYIVIGMSAAFEASAGNFQASKTRHPGLYLMTKAISLVLVFFYYGWFYKNKGATPGKMVMGLKIVDAKTGTNLGYVRSFFRETVGKIISFIILCLGYIMAGIRSDKRALHDLLFGTRVLKRER